MRIFLFYEKKVNVLGLKNFTSFYIGRGQMTYEGKWKIILVIQMQKHGNPNTVAPQILCDVRTVKKWWRVYEKHDTCSVPRNRSGKMGAQKKWDSSVK